MNIHRSILRNTAVLVILTICVVAEGPPLTNPPPQLGIESEPNLTDRGSVYVPLDHWAYGLIARAAALGYVDTQFAGLRPWTRSQFLAMTQQIGKRIGNGFGEAEMGTTYRELSREFSDEETRGASASLDSVYVRGLGIAGNPLQDGYHFGQTLVNDYGRPFGEGANAIAGFSMRAQAGPIVSFVRGEYQHSARMFTYSDPVRELIAAVDRNPVQPPNVSNETNRFRMLEGYVGFGMRGVQLTVGKQSLWWGPGESGGMLMSTNAEPFYMARMANTTPIRLPLLSKVMGPMRSEFFFGKLDGHSFPSGPWIHGQKISFKPTPNLELGFSRTVVFAGAGHPLNFWSFWKSFISVGDNPSTAAGSSRDVGDRRGGFDFSYRVPGLRKWLVVYNDAFTDDDPSPLSAPHRSGMNPGLFMPQVPGFPKLQLRAEGVYTDPPEIAGFGGHFFYYNGGYHDSYTNDQNLLGSWVGRQGHGLLLQATYSFNPLNTLQVVYRRAVIDDDFIPNGGKLNDIRVQSDIRLRQTLFLSGFAQVERWSIPALSATPRSNISIAFQLTYRPQWHTLVRGSEHP